MKKIALISTFCDNQEKLDLLITNIKKIKSLGIDVMIISPFKLNDEVLDFFKRDSKVIAYGADIRKSKNPDLINQIASKYGSQCVVVAIDAKEIDGEWFVHLVGGKVPTELNLFDWAKEVEQRGAGEILFTSMNNDGTKNGFANEALSNLSEIVNIPIIASGGAGTMEHFAETFINGNADAALAASVFHYQEIEITELKQYLKEKEISIRL